MVQSCLLLDFAIFACITSHKELTHSLQLFTWFKHLSFAAHNTTLPPIGRQCYAAFQRPLDICSVPTTTMFCVSCALHFSFRDHSQRTPLDIPKTFQRLFHSVMWTVSTLSSWFYYTNRTWRIWNNKWIDYDIEE